MSIAGPFQKRKGTLTLNLQHSFPISLCVGVHERMPWFTSISSSLWEENGFNTGGYVYSRILEGSGCSICRQMRCSAEPGWGRWCLGTGRRGERKMEIHASCTLFFFLTPHHATKGTNLCLTSVHYIYLYPFPVVWRKIMQFRKFIGMLFFHQIAVLHPTPALLSETGSPPGSFWVCCRCGSWI